MTYFKLVQLKSLQDEDTTPNVCRVTVYTYCTMYISAVKEKETLNFSESVGAVNTDSTAVVFQSKCLLVLYWALCV